MKKITNEMINEFNGMMESAGSSMRIYHDKSFDGTFNVRLNEDPYIDDDNRRAFPNNSFYAELEMFLKPHDVGKIHYNNTRLTFWTLSD